MKIETKFDIGEHVWLVERNNGVVEVFDGELAAVSVDDEYLIEYMLKENYDYYPEDRFVRYDDNAGLLEKIKATMEKIRKEEEENKRK